MIASPPKKNIDFRYKEKSAHIENKKLNIKTDQKEKIINLKNKIYSYITLGMIIFTSLTTAYNSYILSSSKDLSYSIEYNFTNGFDSNKKLLRVKSISIIEKTDNIAVVKVSGLSKNTPHKSISVIGNFQRENKVWVLKHTY